MCSQILGVPQNHVAQRTAFDADVLFFHHVLEVWEQEELETMADSFGVQEDGVVEVVHISFVGFTAMEETWHLLIINDNVVFAVEDLLSKEVDLRGVVFFIYHVEACEELHKSLIGLTDPLLQMIDHLLDMCDSYEFDSCQNQFELKMWSFLLKLIYDFSDGLQLIDKWHLVSIVIKKHARNVPVLHNIALLSNASFKGRFCDLFEEG